MPPIEAFDVEVTDYKGRVYRGFHARRDPGTGPGWYVFGRCLPGVGQDCYGGHVVMLCARPSVPARRHPHYNCQVRRGFRTKAEADAAAAECNRQYPALAAEPVLAAA